jgi:hypothetical protein
MTNEHDTGAWVELMTARTTPTELEQIIIEQTAIALADLHAQLAAMPVTAQERQHMAATVEPIVRSRTRAALTAGWESLQLETSGTIH